MPDQSLQDRITEIVRQHETADYHAFTWTCDCGVDFHETDSHARHVASVLISELGISESGGYLQGWL